MATSLLPQLQPQAAGLGSPTAATPTEAAGLLSRRWDPPPRPKPGRKPATDTPPSKRKAQNRLAQRNFRERRAAKVNELEDQMKDLQAEHDAEIDELNASARQLKNHLALLESTLSADRATMQNVQAELERERTRRQALEVKLARAEEELSKAGVVPLTRRTDEGTRSDRRQQPSTSLSKAIEDADSMQGIDTSKRPPSPPNGMLSSKRPRLDDASATTSISMEIDLTTRPKRSERSMSIDSADTPATSDMPVDPCGFCDSNPDVCPCRAKPGDLTEESAPEPVDLTKTSKSNMSRPSGCSGRPGSCEQCQTDPRSARFCKSFARTHTPPQDPSKPVPPGCGVANCCQVQQPTSHMRTGSLSEKLSALNTGGGNAGGSTYNCAETYRRLKEHPKFDEAMAHVDDWSSQLRPPRTQEVGATARPDLVRRESLEGRTPYEIEAASVMSTLKYFDSKFGKDARGDWRHQN